MILATLDGGGPDGTLVVVSSDRERYALPSNGPRTLQGALDYWDECAAGLEELFHELDSLDRGLPTDRATFHSPLPRAYHWAEGSCYLPHMERIRGSRREDLPPNHTNRPKVYQSGGDQNVPPVSDWALPDAALELDLEATIVTFMGHVPQGASAEEAVAEVRLVGLTNDLTYRKLIVDERREGSGTYISKPGRAYAPFAVTPEGLGELWKGAALHAVVRTEINGTLFGEPWADRDLAFDFGRVMAELCTTRRLAPGAIVGTGTISNTDPVTGIGCIAERRAVEIEAYGAPRTEYLTPGDRMRIDAVGEDGRSLFGRIEQAVIAVED